jgi:hypothetical protein
LPHHAQDHAAICHRAFSGIAPAKISPRQNLGFEGLDLGDIGVRNQVLQYF